ncbi:hypothetical protein [Melioribacter sp. OK-6-Me]|uniref:hypothetical protein n=1 Tax=unclassified Melioribacter TaxID=2627329 RepID=UPI003ED9E519
MLRLITIILFLFLAGCATHNVSVKSIEIAHDNYSFLLPDGWQILDTAFEQNKFVLIADKNREAFIEINKINVNADLRLDEIAELNRYFLKLKFGKNFHGFSEIKIVEEKTYTSARYRFITPRGIEAMVIIKKVNSAYYEITGYTLAKDGIESFSEAQEIIARSLN